MKKSCKFAVLMFTDIVLVNVSLIIAFLLRFDWGIDGIPHAYLDNFFLTAAVYTLVKILCFTFFGLYSSLWKYASVYEMFLIGAAAFAGNIMLFACSLAISGLMPRGVPAMTFFVDIILIGGSRFMYRIRRRLTNGGLVHMLCNTCNYPYKKALIIGGGLAGAIVIKELLSNPRLEIVPAAIIDDDASKHGKRIQGITIEGGRDRIPDIAANKKIDEIIIAIPSAGRKAISDIFNICSKTGCRIKTLPSVTQLIDGSVSVKKLRDVNIDDLLGREAVVLDRNEISAFLKDKAVLVTGGGGSIGSELCRQVALFKPARLIILDNYENNAYEIQNELLENYRELKLSVVIANVREKQRLESIFDKYRPDVVFHAAAHKHVPLMEGNPTEAVKNNVFGTMNAAECADKYHVRKFVLISTDKAVNPTNVMGATKRIAEMLIQAMDRYSETEFAAVRFGNVLGSNGSVIPLFKKQIEQGGPVTVTHPEITRYFMTIPEAVQLVMQAGAMARGGEIFVLDMGQPVKILDLARNLIKLSGFEPDVDIKIEFTGLRPGEKLYEELLLAEEGLKATKNNKIFVAKPVFTDLAMLRREINILKQITTYNSEEVVDYIPNIVPAYRKAQ